MVDPEIAVESEMYDAIEVHHAQTKHLHHLIIKCDTIADKLGWWNVHRNVFGLYSLSGGQINRNKGQICMILIRY